MASAPSYDERDKRFRGVFGVASHAHECFTVAAIGAAASVATIVLSISLVGTTSDAHAAKAAHSGAVTTLTFRSAAPGSTRESVDSSRSCARSRTKTTST